MRRYFGDAGTTALQDWTETLRAGPAPPCQQLPNGYLTATPASRPAPFAAAPACTDSRWPEAGRACAARSTCRQRQRRGYIRRRRRWPGCGTTRMADATGTAGRARRATGGARPGRATAARLSSRAHRRPSVFPAASVELFATLDSGGTTKLLFAQHVQGCRPPQHGPYPLRLMARCLSAAALTCSASWSND
jgi:hypothetical protein